MPSLRTITSSGVNRAIDRTHGTACAIYGVNLQGVTDGEEDHDRGGLRPLADFGRAYGSRAHEHVHVQMSGPQPRERRPEDR